MAPYTPQGIGVSRRDKPAASRQSCSNGLLDALNELWQEGNWCTLPCSDTVCREDCNEEGGCKGADFADKLLTYLASHTKHNIAP